VFALKVKTKITLTNLPLCQSLYVYNQN